MEEGASARRVQHLQNSSAWNNTIVGMKPNLQPNIIQARAELAVRQVGGLLGFYLLTDGIARIYLAGEGHGDVPSAIYTLFRNDLFNSSDQDQ
jgi:hypothetical protein